MKLLKRNWHWYIRNRHSIKPKNIISRGFNIKGWDGSFGIINDITIEKGGPNGWTH